MKLRMLRLRWLMWWCSVTGGHYFRIIGLTTAYESTCMRCGYREYVALEPTEEATAVSDMDRLVEWLQQDEGDYVSSEMQFTVIRFSRLFDHIREMKSGSGL